jgi:DNA polymerase-3 subunit gamma/tau
LVSLREQYKNGADPMSLLKDLISLTHLLAKIKLVPSFINDSSVSEAEREFCAKTGSKVSIAILSKIWQMLIKGIGELQVSPVQIDALEMILIRVAYSASLPTPYDLLNDVKKNSNLTAVSLPKPVAESVPVVVPNQDTPPVENIDTPHFSTLEDIVLFLEQQKYPLLVYTLKNDVCFQELSQGHLKITVRDGVHPEFIPNLIKALQQTTGQNWEIDVLKGSLGETIADKENASLAEKKRDVMAYPLVKAIMNEFKGAKIESLSRRTPENAESAENGDISFETNTDLIFDEETE